MCIFFLHNFLQFFEQTEFQYLIKYINYVVVINLFALFGSFLDFKKLQKKYPFKAWGTILTKNTHVQTFCHFSNDLNSNHDDMKADPIFTPTKNPLCDHLENKKYSFKINFTNWETKKNLEWISTFHHLFEKWNW